MTEFWKLNATCQKYWHVKIVILLFYIYFYVAAKTKKENMSTMGVRQY